MCDPDGCPNKHAPSSREPLKDCAFCDLALKRHTCCSKSGAPPPAVLFENDRLLIIRDPNPASNHHLLAIPKQHIRNTSALVAADRELIHEMEGEMRKLFRQMHVNSCDAVYGFNWPPLYTVPHLHMHGIAPASNMGLLARWVFKPLNLWFCTPQYVSTHLKCGCGSS